MEPYRDDNELAAELRALRPEPRQEFAAELDERAAAGFPRRSSRARKPLFGLCARLRTVAPRRLALSAGAAALAVIAVATVVVAVNEPEGDPGQLAQLSATERHFSSMKRFSAPLGAQAHGAGEGRLAELLSKEGKPSSRGNGSGPKSSEAQYETAIPSTTRHLTPFSEAAAAGTTAAEATTKPFDRVITKGSNNFYDGSGPYVANARKREVERSAEMVLGAEPSEVAGNAAKVFEAVHAVNGIVLGSSVRGGAEGDAGARFELLIPAAKLSDALAAFSAIGTVVSRHEATADITAPAVRTSEHLRDSRARIDGLLVQLAGADRDEERAEVELELRAERRHAAALRSQASKLDRRANLSRVSLRIVTGTAATAPGDSDAWGVGDALGDAGHILAIAAGVAILGLAILAPLALIALLAWLGNRARLRRSRERALT